MLQFNLGFCDYAFHNAVLLFKTGYYWTDTTKNNDPTTEGFVGEKAYFSLS